MKATLASHFAATDTASGPDERKRNPGTASDSTPIPVFAAHGPGYALLGTAFAVTTLSPGGEGRLFYRATVEPRSDCMALAQGMARMLRFVFFTAALLVTADHALAQAPSPEQCEQLKQAVAQYGYAAARRYAVVNYGPEAARAGDLCFARGIRRVLGRRVIGNAAEPERDRKQPD